MTGQHPSVRAVVANLLNASFNDIDESLAVLYERVFAYSLVRQVIGLLSLTAVP